jgi:hypothetical protein
MDVYDWVFVLCALAFNLLIAGIFVVQKHGRQDLTRALGIAWLGLGLPLLVVFVRYLIAGRELWVTVYFALILIYMLVELLLDYVFKMDFRSRKIIHIPYIILEYVALFGLMGISFAINRTWGWIVSISFWILISGLIYLYWGRRRSPGEASR